MYYNIIVHSDVSTFRNWGSCFTIILISKIFKWDYIISSPFKNYFKVLPAFSEVFSAEKLIIQFENPVR